jgi:hypothetical protein
MEVLIVINRSSMSHQIEKGVRKVRGMGKAMKGGGCVTGKSYKRGGMVANADDSMMVAGKAGMAAKTGKSPKTLRGKARPAMAPKPMQKAMSPQMPMPPMSDQMMRYGGMVKGKMK